MAAPYVVHTYFNQQEMVSLLNAVAMFVGGAGDGNFTLLVRTLGIIGLFCACCYGVWKARGEEAGYYVVALALVYGTLFLPRVTVIVEDNSGSYMAGAPRTVGNVPLGLAFVASATSQIGHYLTTRMETMFSVVGPSSFSGYPHDSLKFTSGGLMATNRLLKTSMEARITDPILLQDAANFMRFCINPEVLQSSSALANLLKSGNLWADMQGLVNPGRIVVFLGDPASVYRDCMSAYQLLDSKFNTQATQEQQKAAAKIWPGLAPSSASALFAASLPAAEALIYSASSNINDAIKQRMMINMLDSLPGILARDLNDPAAAMTAMSTAQAASTANSSYRVMANLAKETLPLIHNAIQLVLIGVFPIIILIMVMVGGRAGKVFMNYALMFLWVELWAPLYAIVNYIATMNSLREMKAVLGGATGYTISNAAALYNTTISGEAVAGIMTVTVPLFALALVKGGEFAASSAVNSLMQPTSSAASSIGGQAGAGNVTMGNVSWGNVQANNRGIGSATTVGGYDDAFRVKFAGGSFNTDASGGVFAAKRDTHDFGVGGNVGRTLSQTYTLTEGERGMVSQEKGSMIRGAWTAAREQGLDAGKTRQFVDDFTKNMNLTDSDRSGKIVSADTAVGRRTEIGTSTENTAGTKFATHLEAGVVFNGKGRGGAANGSGQNTGGLGSPVAKGSLGGGAEGTSGERASAGKTAGVTEQIRSSDNTEKAITVLNDMALRYGDSEIGKASNTLAANLRKSLDASTSDGLSKKLDSSVDESTQRAKQDSANVTAGLGQTIGERLIQDDGGNMRGLLHRNPIEDLPVAHNVLGEHDPRTPSTQTPRGKWENGQEQVDNHAGGGREAVLARFSQYQGEVSGRQNQVAPKNPAGREEARTAIAAQEEKIAAERQQKEDRANIEAGAILVGFQIQQNQKGSRRAIEGGVTGSINDEKAAFATARNVLQNSSPEKLEVLRQIGERNKITPMEAIQFNAEARKTVPR